MNRAAVTALIAVACLAVPAAANASVASTNANRRADRAALNAYATYLQSLVADKASGVDAAQLFTQDTRTICYKALEPIAASQSVPAADLSALTSIVGEIDADAHLEFLTTATTSIGQPATTPLGQLATTLSSLHWGSGAATSTVTRFLAADEALAVLPARPLCSDADSVAAQAQTNAPVVTVPPATQTFLETYKSDSSVANARLAAFVKLLNSYVTSSDSGVATKIDLLAIRVKSISTAVITTATKSLLRVLGIPAPQAAAAAAAAPATGA
jgi:roadblock/LC7 domain-containing protein